MTLPKALTTLAQKRLTIKLAAVASEAALAYLFTTALRRQNRPAGLGATLAITGFLAWLEPGRRLADWLTTTMRLLDDGNPLAVMDDRLDLQAVAANPNVADQPPEELHFPMTA